MWGSLPAVPSGPCLSSACVPFEATQALPDPNPEAFPAVKTGFGTRATRGQWPAAHFTNEVDSPPKQTLSGPQLMVSPLN